VPEAICDQYLPVDLLDRFCTVAPGHRSLPEYSSAANSKLEGVIVSEPTKEELMARIAELEKQAGSKRTGRMEFKVSEKGGVSVYGLGRFPVTLYYEQWERLLGAADELRTFLEENKSKLKLKNAE
jgi:hypothetical protein